MKTSIMLLAGALALFGCESDRNATDSAPVPAQPVGDAATPLPQAIKTARPTESVRIETFVNDKLPPYFKFSVMKIEALDDAGTIGVAGEMRALSDLRATSSGRILAEGSELDSQMILKAEDGSFVLKGANFNPMDYQPL